MATTTVPASLPSPSGVFSGTVTLCILLFVKQTQIQQFMVEARANPHLCTLATRFHIKHPLVYNVLTEQAQIKLG